MSPFALDAISPKKSWLEVGSGRYASIDMDGRTYFGIRTFLQDGEARVQTFTVVTGDRAGSVTREHGVPAMELKQGTFKVARGEAPSRDAPAAHGTSFAKEGAVFHEPNLNRFIMSSFAQGHPPFWTCVWSERAEEIGLTFAGSDVRENVYVGLGLAVFAA